MTVHQPQTVQHGVEIAVPLNKLKKSPNNARKTQHRPADIETLAASIAAKGVLQPPVVEPERDADGNETGAYLVTVGEGRRLALLLLAKQKRFAKNTVIRCLLDVDNDAFEVSLDENVTRFAMHPADQFEAFRELSERRGWCADDIAARFGVTPQVVRQRLRLAAVSQNLIDLYRAEELSLEQLMAFAVSDDQARQEQVWSGLSYNRSASYIRRALTEHEVAASDRRAHFVGTEAYLEAGGRVRRDLFAPDDGGWFEDVALIDRLTLEKLAAEAMAVCEREGWRWAEPHLDFPHGHGLRRLYPKSVERDEDERARLSQLSEEYDAIIATCSEDDELPLEKQTRLAEIDAALEDASRPTYAPEDRARAGVFVVLQWDGSVRVERGFVRPGEDVFIESDAPAEGEEASTGTLTAASKSATDKPIPPLSEQVVTDLSAHRTAALRDCLANAPDLAFLAALHAVVLQVFYSGSGESCLEVRATLTSLAPFATTYSESIAAQAIDVRHEAWSARLPGQVSLLWEALSALSPEDRFALFAHSVSLTVNAVVGAGCSRRALAHADQLCEEVDLNMAQYWQATPERYFDHLTKAQILDTVREARSAKAASALNGMKKDAMARAAGDLLGSEGWLPPLLKGAAVPPT